MPVHLRFTPNKREYDPVEDTIARGDSRIIRYSSNHIWNVMVISCHLTDDAASIIKFHNASPDGAARKYANNPISELD